MKEVVWGLFFPWDSDYWERVASRIQKQKTISTIRIWALSASLHGRACSTQLLYISAAAKRGNCPASSRRVVWKRVGTAPSWGLLFIGANSQTSAKPWLWDLSWRYVYDSFCHIWKEALDKVFVCRVIYLEGLLMKSKAKSQFSEMSMYYWFLAL